MNRIFSTIGLSAAAFALVLVPGPAIATPPETPGPQATATATTPVRQEIKVSVTNPTSKSSPITFTVTGLTEGQWVDVDGHPTGWKGERPYHREVQQTGSGPLKIVLEAPVAGWPKGTYEWTVTVPGPAYVKRTTTFTPSATSKPASGGLASTGV